MHDKENLRALTESVGRYLDLMHDCDVTRFDRVFRDTANLHGYRDGAMTVWPASVYRDILAKRTSPKSLGTPREEEVLLVDFASDSQAFVKLRVRINNLVFVDYLTYHRFDGDWLITAKAYHVERTLAAAS